MSIDLICEVCNKEKAVGVACVPMVPMSVAYCKSCLKANAHPWWILIANTVCIGGLNNANLCWQEMVKDTCNHLSKSIEEFNQAVKTELEQMKNVS